MTARGILALFGPVGIPELLIIAFILVLIFGAKRLSGLGRGMGQAIRGFKDEMREDGNAKDEGLKKD
ncbi:MAG: twin-arginine translocase TatA/TatE family subunit [Longimicrobiales bacterium]